MAEVGLKIGYLATLACVMYEGLIQPVLAEVPLDSFAEAGEKEMNLEQSDTVYTSETRYSKKIRPSPVSPVSPVLSSFYTNERR